MSETAMSETMVETIGAGPAVRRRPSRASRRAGYLIAAAINVVLLYLIRVEPGWQAVPFLTDGMTEVLGVVTLSLVAGIVLNLLYVLADPRWLVALGGVVTTAVGVAAMVRLWQVFPFDFEDAATDWAMVVRVVLVVGIVGAGIGIVAQFATLIGLVATACAGDQGGAPSGGSRAGDDEAAVGHERVEKLEEQVDARR